MKIFTNAIPAFLLVLAVAFAVPSAQGQSIMQPTDSVVTYNKNAAAGSLSNPNQPATGTIGHWIRTVRLSWNTREWKCYIYNGMAFRLHFPKSYNPTANDGKKYPLLVFWHGAGEAGAITDNENSLAHGGQTVFQANIDNGTFDGYILVPQNTIGAFSDQQMAFVKQITDYMAINNKLDPFHIVTNGLSAGGAGTWMFQFDWPQVVCASIPMSSNVQGNASPANLTLSKFTPIWDFQGGLDSWPDPTDAGIVNDNEVLAGAQYKYTIYPTLGHDTWDNTWAEPDFWPFILRAYSSNPWALHGQTAFCPGVPILDTLGIAPGYDGYQWRKDFQPIGGNTNTLIVNQLGRYDCSVLRNGVWSDYSHTPVVISTRQPTVTPPIQTNGLESFVIPALDRSNVNLQVPTGYASYVWQKVGSNTTISSTNTLNVTSPGQYIVEVTQTGGCSSSFSAPFTVASASGPNPPDAASGVLASPLSQTSVLLNWNQNPSPAHNEVNFEIYQASKSGGPYTLIAVTGQDASKDTITGLNAGTNYFYVIRAVDSTGASAASAEASVITTADAQAPTAPGALVVTGTGFNSVGLDWTASTDNVGVVAYDIYVNGIRSYSVPASQTAFTVYSLVNQQSYVFVVKARDQAGNVSIPSNQVTGQPVINGITYNYYNGLPTSIDSLPNFYTLTASQTGSVPNFSLSPASDATYFGFLFNGLINIPTTGTYTFQTNSDDGTTLYLGTRGSTVSPYNFSGKALVNNDGLHGGQNRQSTPMTLQAGVYPIAVAYFQQAGGDGLTISWKIPGSGSFQTIPNSAFQQTPVNNGSAPAAPSNLKASTQSYNSIALQWTDNSNNETGFEVWRGGSADNSSAVIIGTTGAGASSFVDATASASTRYFYEVRAVNQFGASNFTSNYTEAEFKFNNNYNDSSGNNHSLTPLNSPTFDNSTMKEGAFSVKLNGTNQAITISNTGSFLQESYFQRTIATWIRATTTTGTNRVVWEIGGSSNGISLEINNNTLIAAIASGSSRKSISASFTSTAWNHVAVVYYGDTLQLYVNGVVVASNTSLGFHSIATTTDGARIGQTNGTNALNTTGSLFSGWIDDFGVYNTALSQDVIQGLMNLNFTASNAMTNPLPAAPTAPGNLNATATGAHTINVTWQDTATNVGNFQLYRSAGNDQSFVLIATLPAGTFSYGDAGLFANALYFYKVNAVNVGGASAFAPENSATTQDIPPTITAIADQQARYSTTTVIPVTAVSNTSSLVLTASNLPSFATFTDNGNGTGKITLNPAVSDAGNYTSLTVTATDLVGQFAQTSFNLAINNNFAPTLDSIPNYSVNDGDSISIPLNGHNVNPADILTLAVSNVPTGNGSTSALNQNNSGAGTLVLKPWYAADGTYAVQVTVNDNNGLSTSRNFTLTVVKKSPPSSTIYARIQARTALGAPWNNITSPAGISQLVDAQGNTTSVGVSLNTNFWDAQPLGPTTGNNSGVYPDAVLNEFWYFGLYGGPANPSLIFTGLNPSFKYNVTLFAASAFGGVPDNGTTTYTSGGQTVNINVQNNTQNTAVLSALTPAPDGSLNITMGRLGTNYPGYLNAVVIQNNFNDNLPPAAPDSLVANGGSGTGVNLAWRDHAYNETSYQVFRSLDNSSFSLVATLPANTTSYSDTSVSGNKTYYYAVNAVNAIGTSPNSDTSTVSTPDRIPQLAAIANVTVNNTQSVQVNVTANDDATDHVTLTVGNLPTFATFVDNGNGTGVITITPTAGLQGSFNNVTVTATDLSDSSRSTSFNINVVDPAVTYVYVNITTPDNQAPAPWNNLTAGYIPFPGTAATNLLSQTGTPTGITVTLTDGWAGVAETGEKRRNGSDLYPESVLGSSFYCSDNTARRITVTGLDPNKAYNFQFFASHNTSESTLTRFTANGQTVAINGSHNSNQTGQINGITPDGTGTVVISCQKDAAAKFMLLSALVIESYTPGNATPISPADLRKLDYAKSGTVALQWQDRASNETGYEVWRAPDGGSYSLLVSLPANSTSYVDGNLPAGTTYDYLVRAVNGANKSPFSNPVKGYTYQSTVFVFMNRIWPETMPHNPAPPPFNNLNWMYPAFPDTWYNFNDENGMPTNVGMSQPDPWDEVECCGAGTGNNSGVFPDVAMNQSWLNFIGDSSYVIFTGLDASKTYDFTLFGSATDDNTANSSARYAVTGANGTQSGILNGHLNTTGTITFFGIQPDASGNISIGMTAYDSSNASFAELGVVVIKGYTPSTGSIPPAPTGVVSTPNVASAVASQFVSNTDSLESLKRVTAYPNPFNSSFTLSVPAMNGDNIVVSITDPSGRKLFTEKFDNLVEGNNQLQIRPNTNLAPGVYFVEVLYVNRSVRKNVIIVKQHQ